MLIICAPMIQNLNSAQSFTLSAGRQARKRMGRLPNFRPARVSSQRRSLPIEAAFPISPSLFPSDKNAQTTRPFFLFQVIPPCHVARWCFVLAHPPWCESISGSRFQDATLQTHFSAYPSRNDALLPPTRALEHYNFPPIPLPFGWVFPCNSN